MNLLLDKRHEVGCTWLHNHQDLMLIDEQIFLKINLNFFQFKNSFTYCYDDSSDQDSLVH